MRSHAFFFAPLPLDAGANKRQVALLVGQSIFTPENKAIVPPDPRDRPYAGLAYGGASLLQETALRKGADGETFGMLENAAFDVGLVCPGALGKKVQNDFHQFIGDPQAQGWSSRATPAATITTRTIKLLLGISQDGGACDPGRLGVSSSLVFVASHGRILSCSRLSRSSKASATSTFPSWSAACSFSA